MTPTFMELAVAVLATWQIVEVWHHSSLTRNVRDLLSLKENTLAQLLLCPFCLSVWVGVGTIVIVLAPYHVYTASEYATTGTRALAVLLASVVLILASFVAVYLGKLCMGHVSVATCVVTALLTSAQVVALVMLIRYFALTVDGTILKYSLLVFAKVVIAGLAVSRLANIGNDACHAFTRTPKNEGSFAPEHEEEENGEGNEIRAL
jgi:hypothetical protein